MNFKQLSKLSYKEIKKETIIYYHEVGGFCSRPYPDHPKGCPNIKKCQMLDVPCFGEILKGKKYTHFYLIYLEFDFK